jgi:hypothetical protein
MKQYNNNYAQKIQAILIPLLGEFMANGVLKKQAEMLGVTEETLEMKHIPILGDNIKKGLGVFLGAEKAQSISNLIKGLY